MFVDGKLMISLKKYFSRELSMISDISTALSSEESLTVSTLTMMLVGISFSISFVFEQPNLNV